MFSKRARAIGKEWAESEAQTTAINEYLSDPLRCRYDDCVEQHPVTMNDTEQITCPSCRDYMGLPALGDEPSA